MKIARYPVMIAILVLILTITVDPVLAAPREPEKPIDILDKQYYPHINENLPIYKHPSSVIAHGRKIPFETIMNKPEWERYASKKTWHSSYWGGRFSYVPGLVHNALHRLFVSYPFEGAFFDFTHDVGIEDTPVRVKSKGPYDKLVVAVMQADVKGVYTLNNQIVIVASPKRPGLHIFTLNSNDIQPLNIKEPIVVQLTTDKGEEIDYAAFGKAL